MPPTAKSEGNGNILVGILGVACVFGWGSEAVILRLGVHAEDDAVDNETALRGETTSAFAYGLHLCHWLVQIVFAAQVFHSCSNLHLYCCFLRSLFYYKAIDTPSVLLAVWHWLYFLTLCMVGVCSLQVLSHLPTIMPGISHWL